jgi:hypothetical protein
MNSIRIIVSVAQQGPSQMRHVIKHLHGPLCQILYNCMNGASGRLQELEADSEAFNELTLVTSFAPLTAQDHSLTRS